MPDGEILQKRIRDLCGERGAEMVGFADLNRLDFPGQKDPGGLLPDCSSAVSFGIHLNGGSLLNLPETRNSYMMEFRQVNHRLNSINYDICTLLENNGYRAIGAPGTASTGVEENLAADISHKHLAVQAGLGGFGLNNLVLTKEYGPAVRFSTVITTADFKADAARSSGTHCHECQSCVKACPVDALSDWQDSYSPAEGWPMDKEACYHHIFVRLNGQRCGLCIKACPQTG